MNFKHGLTVFAAVAVAFAGTACGGGGGSAAVPSRAMAASGSSGHVRQVRSTYYTCTPSTDPECTGTNPDGTKCEPDLCGTFTVYATCNPATDTKCTGTNPDGTSCEPATCGTELAANTPPTCTFATDPMCTGIDNNGNPCDPFLASCGPGGDPLVFVDPSIRWHAQIVTHQPQCSDKYPAGTRVVYFHQCYVMGYWHN
jgi:hypothetical protein